MKKNILSFKYFSLLFFIGITFFIIGQIVNKRFDLSSLIFVISTIIIAPLSYLSINKSFKKLNSVKNFILIVFFYSIIMILLGVILYFLGLLK